MGNSTIVQNRVVTSPREMDVNGNNDGGFYLAGAFTGRGALTNIAACYELEKLVSCTVRWQPSVGMTTTGTVYMGYIDNAEMIAKWGSYGADRYTIIKNLPDMVSTSIYAPMTCVWRKPARRRWYNLDKSITATDASQVERSVMGLFVYFIEGGPSGLNVGSFVLEETHLLSGLINPLAVTTFTKGAETKTDHEIILLPPPSPSEQAGPQHGNAVSSGAME